MPWKHEGTEINLQAFLTLAANGGPTYTNFSAVWLEGWVGPRADLNVVKVLYPSVGIDPYFWSIQPIAWSLYWLSCLSSPLLSLPKFPFLTRTKQLLFHTTTVCLAKLVSWSYGWKGIRITVWLFRSRMAGCGFQRAFCMVECEQSFPHE